MKNRLTDKYIKEVVPELKKSFGYTNNLAVPRLEKVVLNVGISSKNADPKFLENVESGLQRISGQKPVRTLARLAISNFKIRQGQVVGLMVTLRGQRMYQFVDKLVSISLPRVRDFRGLEAKSLDDKGNLNIGFKENLAFPEIKADEMERTFGLEVAIKTTAKNKAEGLALLKLLGFPIK
ncbi:MAG: 50S ribosomal protein L5 [Candidatus Buchananbacteria bacterium]